MSHTLPRPSHGSRLALATALTSLALTLACCGASEKPGGMLGPVILTKGTTYVMDTGTSEVPEDLSPRVGTGFYQALVPNGSGGFTTVDTFSAPAPGSGLLTDVPQGPYWLKTDLSTYLWTDSRVIDLGNSKYTRPDPALAASGTSLTLDLTGMTPWTTQGNLYLYAPNIDFVAYLSDIVGTGPNDQHYPDAVDTSMHATFDWSGSPLLNGNGLYLGAMRLAPSYLDDGRDTDASSLGIVQVLQDALGPLALNQPDGTNTKYSGTMSLPSVEGEFRVNWDRPAFLACQQDMVGTTSPDAWTDQGWRLFGIPGGSARGLIFSNAPDLGNFYPVPHDGALVNLKPMPFRNPFPSDWGIGNWASMTFTRTYQVPRVLLPPGAPDVTVASNAFLQNFDTALPAAGKPVGPMVTPPTKLTLQKDPTDLARPAADDLTGVGLTPILAWTGPQPATANNYHVKIFHLDKTQNFNPVLVATLFTHTTTVQLPPKVLAQGEYYFFRVRAIHMEGVDLTTEPNRSGLPYGTADALTGLVTP